MVYAISGGVQADRTGDSLAEMLRETREFLTISGVTTEELERSIASEVGALPGRFETSPAVLGAMQGNALYGRPDDLFSRRCPISIARKHRTASMRRPGQRSMQTVSSGWWSAMPRRSARSSKRLGLPIEQREMEAGE